MKDIILLNDCCTLDDELAIVEVGSKLGVREKRGEGLVELV